MNCTLPSAWQATTWREEWVHGVNLDSYKHKYMVKQTSSPVVCACSSSRPGPAGLCGSRAPGSPGSDPPRWQSCCVSRPSIRTPSSSTATLKSVRMSHPFRHGHRICLLAKEWRINCLQAEVFSIRILHLPTIDVKTTLYIFGY